MRLLKLTLLLRKENPDAVILSGAAFAITISTLIRFVCHLDQGPIAINMLPLGVIFAFVFWRWRLLWPLVVAHGVIDLLGLMPQAQ